MGGRVEAADYVIVGSGISALVAAALLARRGESVLVLERSDRIGGCLRSDEITEPGFVHDVMAATFVLFTTGPAHAALGDDLARHGLDFCNGSSPTGVLRPDGSSLVLSTDRAENARRFDAVAPGDGAAHLAQMGHVEDNADLIFGLLGSRLKSRKTAGLVGREAWRRRPAGLMAFAGEAMASSRAHLETQFSSDLVRALFAPWCLHAGFNPEAAFSGEMVKVIAFALEAAGAPVARGGAGRAATAFERLIRENGGRVMTGSEVRRIEVAGGRATGVVLSDERLIPARKGVICSVTPNQLYEQLLGEEDAGEKRAQARAYRYGKGNFQLHYALDAAPDWGDPALNEVALLHLTDGLDAVSKAVNEAERGMLPEAPTICVGQPAALDPSRCPAGKAILWLQIPDVPRTIKGDAAGRIDVPADGAWSEDVREAFADRVEDVLRRHIRNFDAIKLRRRAMSPADLEALNVNLVGGDPYGGACTVDQFFTWRPFKDSVNHRTHIRDLYHIGASTHPGPGLGGGSGVQVVDEL